MENCEINEEFMATPFYEDKNIPLPVQRLDWMAKIQDRIYPMFSKIKKEQPKGQLCTMSLMADYVEEFYQDAIQQLALTDNMNIWKTIEIQMVYNMVFMYNWGVYKQSYHYDEDFFSLLMYETDCQEIPVSVLLEQMPYPAFWIDNRFEDEDSCRYRGVYISLIFDRPEKPELGLFFVEDTPESDYKYCLLPLYYGDKNIDELLDMRNKEFASDGDAPENLHDPVNPNIIKDLVKGIINAILYLTADNKEVVVKKVKTTRKGATGSLKNKDITLKSTNNKVGYRIGSVIRKTKTLYIHEENEQSGNSAEKHKKKTPHTRRAHYHRFWTGSKSDPSSRKLSRLFLPPMYINNYLDEDLQPTLHECKNQ